MPGRPQGSYCNRGMNASAKIYETHRPEIAHFGT